MHSEDYVHRIGRTGRAHAVGEAISFVTSEDRDELRALERFIGRGIVRKKAEGFNYAASAPPMAPEAPRRFQQGRNQGRPQPSAHPASPQHPGRPGQQQSRHYQQHSQQQQPRSGPPPRWRR
jgi:ATP-dependent RNA helicase RhlE